MKVQSSCYYVGFWLRVALRKGVSFEMKVQGLLSKMLALVAQNLGMGFGF